MVARQLTIVGGLGVLVVGTMAFQANDLEKNYLKVDATIKEVKIDCYVENARSKIVEKETDDIAYMDCALAPFAAEKYGYRESDIHKRAQVVYQYKSPVDRNFYRGEFTRKDDVEAYAKGATINIFAHKEDPSKSKTPSGNLFLGDENV